MLRVKGNKLKAVARQPPWDINETAARGRGEVMGRALGARRWALGRGVAGTGPRYLAFSAKGCEDKVSPAWGGATSGERVGLHPTSAGAGWWADAEKQATDCSGQAAAPTGQNARLLTVCGHREIDRKTGATHNRRHGSFLIARENRGPRCKIARLARSTTDLTFDASKKVAIGQRASMRLPKK